MNSYTYLIFFACLTSLFTSCNDNRTFPNKEWLRSSPEEQNINSILMNNALSSTAEFFGPDKLNETVIIRNGFIVFEGDSIYNQHNIYSCTKSFTSTVLGLLIDENMCKLDDFCSQYDSTLLGNYGDIKLRHFSSMTSGYNAVGGSRWCGDCSQDWSYTPYVPSKPLFKPGEKFCYWDEAQMYFGKILTIIANEDLHKYLDTRIMRKIGITNWDWWYEDELNGIPLRNGCTGITLSAVDLARFGYLFLMNGYWHSENLISKHWITQATSIQVNKTIPVADTDRKSIKGNGRYGFNWWLKGDMGDMPGLPDGSYYMSGLNNNVCFVIPEWNMVFVRMGDDYNPKEGKRFVYNIFFKELSKAINK